MNKNSDISGFEVSLKGPQVWPPKVISLKKLLENKEDTYGTQHTHSDKKAEPQESVEV